jgi:hypothetical protein
MKSFSRASDIYSAMWPLHFLLRIFGLAPYSLKAGSETSKYAAIFTGLRQIWSIIWIILFVALEYIGTTVTISQNALLKKKITSILSIVSLNSGNIITLFLSLTINRGKVPQILAKFSEIDQLFWTKGHRKQIYKNPRLFLTFQLALTISFIMIFYAYYVYDVLGYFSFADFCMILIAAIPVLFNSMTILHFVNLVFPLRDKYKYLNSVLETSPVTTCDLTYFNYRNMNNMAPSEIYISAMKTSITTLKHNRISSTCKDFHNLRIIYSQLHDVALLINSTYGISLLCAAFWMFIGVATTLNNVIDMKHTGHDHVLPLVLFSSYCLALMTMMAVCCSLAVNECNRSPVIVQKIMLRDDIDREVMKELEKMFTQFKVMKIGFSACGMCKIDLSFLCGIIGATISYLIIFTQL